MRLDEIDFHSVCIGQRIRHDADDINGRVIGGEVGGYTWGDSDMLTIEWYHTDGTIGVVSCPHQHCNYEMIDANDAEVEVIPCDYCGAEITDFENDLKHVSGIIDGEFNNHIHLCKSCFERLKVPTIDLDALQKAANFYTTRRQKSA